MRKMGVVTGISLLLFVSNCWAHDLLAGMMLQKNAPVRWNSLIPKVYEDFAVNGVVHNYASKQVVAIQLGWVVFVGCTDSKPYDVTLGPLQTVALAPDAIESIKVVLTNGSDIQQRRSAAGAKTATVAIGIIRVGFDDGSEWSHDLKADPTFEHDTMFNAIESVGSCLRERSATTVAPSAVGPLLRDKICYHCQGWIFPTGCAIGYPGTTKNHCPIPDTNHCRPDSRGLCCADCLPGTGQDTSFSTCDCGSSC